MAGFELGTDGPGTILVGMDGSDTSMRAGAYALGTARRQGARVVVLFVAGVVGFSAGLAGSGGAVNATNAEIGDDLETQVQVFGDQFGVELSFVRRHGNPYAELVRVAEQLRVDAIVIGASMQAGHRLVGSLAGRLVRDAKWPVTVVP